MQVEMFLLKCSVRKSELEQCCNSNYDIIIDVLLLQCYYYYYYYSLAQYDRLLAQYCHLSVSPSICDTVHCGAQGQCRRLKHVPSCS